MRGVAVGGHPLEPLSFLALCRALLLIGFTQSLSAQRFFPWGLCTSEDGVSFSGASLFPSSFFQGCSILRGRGIFSGSHDRNDPRSPLFFPFFPWTASFSGFFAPWNRLRPGFRVTSPKAVPFGFDFLFSFQRVYVRCGDGSARRASGVMLSAHAGLKRWTMTPEMFSRDPRCRVLTFLTFWSFFFSPFWNITCPPRLVTPLFVRARVFGLFPRSLRCPAKRDCLFTPVFLKTPIRKPPPPVRLRWVSPLSLVFCCLARRFVKTQASPAAWFR